MPVPVPPEEEDLGCEGVVGCSAWVWVCGAGGGGC